MRNKPRIHSCGFRPMAESSGMLGGSGGEGLALPACLWLSGVVHGE